ncbi:MAG: hypothetical protein LBP87_09045 [Planctomycetaceae bacterium]|jgi:hypothetical protein|nr:hypothetical protein [Planctomycetaceae bacterium]
MKRFRIINFVCIVFVILLGQTLILADIPPFPRKEEQNRKKQNQDQDYPNEQPSKPQKRFGCKLFGTANIPNSQSVTTIANSVTTNSNSPQLWADLVPSYKDFINTIIITGIVISMITISSAISLRNIIRKSRDKQEPLSTPLELEPETNSVIETAKTTENVTNV